MKDYPIGTTFTHEGVELEVAAQRGCTGCYFEDVPEICPDKRDFTCSVLRNDATSVIFNEVKPKTE